MNNVYNKKQWNWIRQKREDGYTFKELAYFLGVSISAVYYQCITIEQPKREPLDNFKEEFNKLGDNNE